MTATGTKVWDLADASHDRTVRRRGIDLGGPVSAALGAVALAGAVAPGMSVEARWSLVVAAGVIAVLVGFSAVRRRQALASLLLAVAGLVLPIAAGAVAADAAVSTPATVTSTVVGDAVLRADPPALTPSASFASLPAAERGQAQFFAIGLVMHLRLLHGPWGPFPTSLDLSDGSVVESSGGLLGTPLGAVPDRSRLVYEVDRSGTAFRVTVVSTDDPSASVSTGSSLVLPPLGQDPGQP